MPGLDGVRGLAILITVLHNSGTILQSGPDVSWVIKVATTITWSGWVGVQLFFVLSGFLITGILLEQRAAPRYFRNFYIRRALRIFPLYYLTLAIAFLVLPAFLASPQYVHVVQREEVWYWTYLSNWAGAFGHRISAFNHFWSLAVEEQFYLVWPIVVLAATTRRLTGICLSLLVAALGFRAAVHWLGLPSELAYSSSLARADSLAAGALLAILARDAELYRLLRSSIGRLAIATAIATCAIALWRREYSEIDPVVQIVGQTLIIGPCLWLILAAQRTAHATPTRTVRFLESPALRSFGRYSYAMYVIHWPMHYLASGILAPWVNHGDTATRLSHQLLYIAGILTATTLLAIASWYVFEKRVLALKDRLAPLWPIPLGSRANSVAPPAPA